MTTARTKSKVSHALEPVRRGLAWVLGAVFVLGFAALDVLLRFDAYRGRPALVLDALASVFVWGALLAFVRGRTTRAALFGLHAFGFVLVLACARYYRVPLDVQMAETARHAWGDVRAIVVRSLPTFTLTVLALAGLTTWALGDRGWRMPPHFPLAGLWLGLVGSSPGAASPDARLVAATSVLVRPRAESAKRVGGASLVSLPSTRARIPNVLLVLGESLRADDACGAKVGGGACEAFRETMSVLPGRIPFENARAVSSYTAVSLSALLTGRTQDGPRDALLSAPNLFDLARAVRRGDERPTVVYASSQLESVFEQKDPRGQVDVFVTAEALLGRTLDDIDEVLSEDLDGKLAAHLERLVPTLPEPFFLFVHLVGTHAPYFEDPSLRPFQPASHVVSFGNLPELRNAYKNAIAAQDVRLARIVRSFVARSKASPYVVLFTSDHAEAFGERGAIHHGQNLHDEQIHVPFFVAAENGALDEGERARLVARAGRSVTHLDVLPTLVDVYGVGHALGLVEHGARLAGRSLVRPELPELAPTAVTNCTGMFPCPVNTWGMLGERHKVVMQAWDGEWRCESLVPAEHEEIPWSEGCVRLLEASRGVFPKKPNGAENR